MEDWITPDEELDILDRIQKDKDNAVKLLLENPKVLTAVPTDCHIPLQIDVTLTSGKYLYIRNSRVGGDTKVYIFDKYYDLSKGWPEKYDIKVKKSDATTYTILAEKALEIIKDE